MDKTATDALPANVFKQIFRVSRTVSNKILSDIEPLIACNKEMAKMSPKKMILINTYDCCVNTGINRKLYKC